MSTPTLPVPTEGTLGPFILGAHVRDAAERTLNLWLPTYLYEASRRLGIPVASSPTDTNATLKLWPFDTWTYEPDDRALSPVEEPQWAIATFGTQGEPRRKGDGKTTAQWLLQVHIWLHGESIDVTRDMTSVYLGIVRMAIAQHGALGGLAVATKWTGEQITDRDIDALALRSQGHGIVSFLTTVEDCLDVYAGPAQALPDPRTVPPEPVDITSVTATITRLPAEAPVPDQEHS